MEEKIPNRYETPAGKCYDPWFSKFPYGLTVILGTRYVEFNTTPVGGEYPGLKIGTLFLQHLHALNPSVDLYTREDPNHPLQDLLGESENLALMLAEPKKILLDQQHPSNERRRRRKTVNDFQPYTAQHLPQLQRLCRDFYHSIVFLPENEHTLDNLGTSVPFTSVDRFALFSPHALINKIDDQELHMMLEDLGEEGGWVEWLPASNRKIVHPNILGPH